MVNKTLHYKFLAFAFIVIAVGIGFSYAISHTAKTAPTDKKEFTLSETSSGWKTYKNEKLGFSMGFPTSIFTFSDSKNGFSLMSPYYVVENYKGTPDGEFKHPFKIDVTYQDKPVLDAIEQYFQYGDTFLQSFPQGTLESFSPSPDASRMMAGGRQGFLFTLGIEGTNTSYFFIEKSPMDTLIIRETYFTDFLAKNVKPQPFSEKQQEQAFASVIATLQFTK